MFFFGIAEAELRIDDLFDKDGKFCLYGEGVEGALEGAGGAAEKMGDWPPICHGVFMNTCGCIRNLRRDGNYAHKMKDINGEGRRNYSKDEGQDGVAKLIKKLLPDAMGGNMIGADAMKVVNKIFSAEAEAEKEGEKEAEAEKEEAGEKKKKKKIGKNEKKEYLTAVADGFLYIERKRREMDEAGLEAGWEEELELSAKDFLGKANGTKNPAKEFIDEALKDEKKYGYPEHIVENVMLAYIAFFFPNTEILGKFYQTYAERRQKFFPKQEGGEGVKNGHSLGKFGKDDVATLEKLAKYFRSGGWIYSTPCGTGKCTEHFDENGNKITGGGNGDCQESVNRDILLGILGNEGIRKLKENGKVGGIEASNNNRIGRIKAFCENVGEGNYNSTLTRDRNYWNWVVSAMKDVLYEQGNRNELLPGFKNLINTLARMLGLDELVCSPQVDGGHNVDELKKSLIERLTKIFEFANPDCRYILTFGEFELKARKKETGGMEAFGKLNVKMQDKVSNTVVHEFTISQTEVHGEISFANLNEKEKKEAQDALGEVGAREDASFRDELWYLFNEKYEGQNFLHRAFGYSLGGGVKVLPLDFAIAYDEAKAGSDEDKKKMVETICQSMSDRLESGCVVVDSRNSGDTEPHELYKKYCRKAIVQVGGKWGLIDLLGWKELKELRVEKRLSDGNMGGNDGESSEIDGIVVPEALTELNVENVKINNDLDLSKWPNLKALGIGDGAVIKGKVVVPGNCARMELGAKVEIGGLDFSGCLDIRSLCIKAGTKITGKVVVPENCAKMELGAKVEIGGLDFSGCSKLESLLIGNEAVIKGEVVGGGELTDVTIGAKVEIGGVDFSGCPCLKTLKFGYGEIKCGSIVLSKSLEVLGTGDVNALIKGGQDLASQCPNLKVLEIASGEVTDGAKIVAKTLETVRIGGEVKVKVALNFLGCQNLKTLVFKCGGMGHASITLPESLETLVTADVNALKDGSNFSGCPNLRGLEIVPLARIDNDLVLPKGLVWAKIWGGFIKGKDVALNFSECPNLKALILGSGRMKSGSITLPESLEVLGIGESVYALEGGPNLETQCPNLRVLEFSPGVTLGTEVVLPKTLESLTILDGAADGGLNFAKCPNLKLLDYGCKDLRDSSNIVFPASLETLRIRQRMNKKVLDFSGFPKLKDLCIGSIGEDGSISALTGSFTRLDILGDARIRGGLNLSECEKLEHLDIGDGATIGNDQGKGGIVAPASLRIMSFRKNSKINGPMDLSKCKGFDCPDMWKADLENIADTVIYPEIVA
ncbi:MAG: hypothetical protein LBJ16_02700 [Holosporaceae bacterium]|nr:hypothetical protein [Holosporaceae bacterium]